MKTYLSSGMRPIHAEGIADAAVIFALRLARKKFGRRARVVTMYMEGWNVGMTWIEYSAFIGYPCGEHGQDTRGHNVMFKVQEK